MESIQGMASSHHDCTLTRGSEMPGSNRGKALIMTSKMGASTKGSLSRTCNLGWEK